VIELGNELGIEIVAEGIETAQQADWLRRMGDVRQGNHFARPMRGACVPWFVTCWNNILDTSKTRSG
jgi:EAL domain-containing protein (putative c-di-GMP-specific phosphodiesterase class I)